MVIARTDGKIPSVFLIMAIVNIDFVFNIKQLIGFDRQKTFDVFLFRKQFQRTFVEFVFGYFLQRIAGNLAYSGVFAYPAGSFQFRRRIDRATDDLRERKTCVFFRKSNIHQIISKL